MMRWTGKVFGGVVGMLVGSVPGAAIGALLGHLFDEASAGDEPAASGPAFAPAEIAEQFFRSTFRIMGHIAKSDGRVSEQEIAAARGIMAALRLDSMQVAVAIEEFTRGKQPSFDVAAELATLRRAFAGRPDLVRTFVEIQVRASLAGNNMQGPARKYVKRVAATLGLSEFELAQIEAILRMQRGNFRRDQQQQQAANGAQQLTMAYQVLEISATASDAEVEKAYRRQLSRHHPDKLKANGLPDSMIEHAKERTQQIIEAWELIKERRGIS
ncbi:MAG TPA: co-chaperone DjlA [Steroidobacteraceae bacterium]|jgi:DnaJ like chaperone protein|nr:co-chaperone DjlA [Steroidobacteraceae bacterium]